VKAKKLIENASFGPEEVKAIGKAFDDAWDQIGPHVSQRPDAIEAARLKLANIVLGLARRGERDPEKLAEAAVESMFRPPADRK
jgi:hypothetical protein